MSAAEDLIERLAQLSRRDRNWILERLSAGAKANLLRQLSPGSGDTAANATGANTTAANSSERPAALQDERALDGLDGESVAACLAAEPSWLIAMILGVRGWRWEHQVLARVPPVTRLEVNQLRSSLPRASTAMKGVLIHTLWKRLQAPQSDLRFDQLLDRAQSRGAQRT